MIRRFWPGMSLAGGSALLIAACVAVLVDELLAIASVVTAVVQSITLPISTPYTATGSIGGVGLVVAGVWLLRRVARRRRINKDDPVRAKRANPPTARRADRVQDTIALRARLRGGSAAASRRTNGGEAAQTEKLPAVDDDGGHLVDWIPSPGSGRRMWTGRTLTPRWPGRSTQASVRRSRGGDVRTMVAASASHERVEAATLQLPPVRVERGTRLRAVAATVPGGSGAATTQVLHSVCASRVSRVGAPHATNRLLCGDAALVPVEGRDEGRSTTWTPDGVASTAGRDEIHH